MQYAAKISKILKTASSSQLVEFMTRKEPEIQTERSCYTLSAKRMPFHLTLSTCQAPTDNQRTYKVAAFGVAPLKPLRRTACPGHAAHGRVRERTLRATNSFMQTCLLLGGPFHSYRWYSDSRHWFYAHAVHICLYQLMSPLSHHPVTPPHLRDSCLRLRRRELEGVDICRVDVKHNTSKTDAITGVTSGNWEQLQLAGASFRDI